MRLVAARAGAVVATTAVMGVGVWVTGGVLTDDASVARVLTGAWFVVVGGLAVAVALRWRAVAVAVVGAWLVTSVAMGGFLLLTSSVDRTIDEDVVRAQPSTARPVHRARDGRAGQGGSSDPGGRRPLPVRCPRHPRSGLARPTALGRPGSDADPFRDRARAPTCGSTSCRRVATPATPWTWAGSRATRATSSTTSRGGPAPGRWSSGAGPSASSSVRLPWHVPGRRDPWLRFRRRP